MSAASNDLWAVRALDLVPRCLRDLPPLRSIGNSDNIPIRLGRMHAEVECNLFRRGVAEFVGAFTLIFIGGGAGVGTVRLSRSHKKGLAIGIMVSNLGHISGGHFNPAITLGFVATRRIAMHDRNRSLDLPVGEAPSSPRQSCALCSRTRSSSVQVSPALQFSAGDEGVPRVILTFFLVWAVFATAVDPGRRLQVDRRPRRDQPDDLKIDVLMGRLPDREPR